MSAAPLCSPSPIRWFHSYDFGDEVISGIRTLDRLRGEEEAFLGNRIAGKTVLDVGAWDGYFSFAAERRGAASVHATDHFCWSGPGWGTKAGFDYAHRKLHSHVRSTDIDVKHLTPATVGKSDVVMFFGVLYHLEDPFGGLRKVAALTNELLIIETVLAENENKNPVMKFYLGKELDNDPTNFWGPNLPCMLSMLKEIGFTRFEHAFMDPVRRDHTRGVIHAYWK